MKIDLSNKIALVTGAARGIGRAIADTLAENGAKVIYTDVLPCSDVNGVAYEMNVTNESQIIRIVDEVVENFGKLDIVVNNAGVNTLKHRVTIDQFPREEWDRILDVDLTGLYVVSKHAARVMKLQGTGKIVNIASIAGLVPLRLQSPFTAAKAGVVNLTKAMAIELGSAGINVNCVAPGSILTEATRELFYGPDGTFRDSVQKLIDHIPLGRPGKPEEIAYAVLYLVSPQADYVNGAILTVDGGWTAGGFARDF